MKQLIDFVPLVVFFVAYKIEGIYTASAVLLVASVLVYGGFWIWQKHLERFQWITLVLVVMFCSLTLLFQSESILKWKAPIANWLFALIFLASHFIGRKTLCERMMGHVVTLPSRVWRQLNVSWIGFFLLTGTANFYVAFHFHEIWVDFKVFGSLGLTLIFMVFQAIFLAKHVTINEQVAVPDVEQQDQQEKPSREH